MESQTETELPAECEVPGTGPICLLLVENLGTRKMKETNRSGLIFQSEVFVDVAPSYQHLLPGRGLVHWGIAGTDWFGMVRIQHSGFFRARQPCFLWAFSTNPKAIGKSGLVTATGYPEYHMGVIHLPTMNLAE